MLRRWFASSPENTAPENRKAGTDPDGLVRVSVRSLLALRQGGEHLKLRVSRIASLRAGNYLSPFKGRGMEFDEVRPYQQGDDVRTIDWRVTARTGRAHTKLFREERERPVLLWVDLRPGMFFATQGAFKAVRAAQAAALVGWAAVARGDRLGGLLVAADAHEEMRPRRGKAPLLHLLSRLGEHPVWGQASGDLEAAGNILHQGLNRLHQVTQPGSLVFLFSDFAGLDEAARNRIGQLARHNEVVIGFTYDPLEAELPPDGLYRFTHAGRNVSVDTTLPALRSEYRERFTRRWKALEQLSGLRGVYFLPMPTTEEPLGLLRRAMGEAQR